MLAFHDVVGAERQAWWEEDDILEKCPHALQIHQRTVRFHYMAAKGPVYARSFIRKILGNEGEYDFIIIIDKCTRTCVCAYYNNRDTNDQFHFITCS